MIKRLFSKAAPVIFCLTLWLLRLPQTFALEHQDLLQKVLANNPDIVKAQSQYEQSVLDYKDALSGYGPTVDLQVSGTYMVNPPVGKITVSTQDIKNQLDRQGVNSAYIGQQDAYLTLYEGMENTLYSFQLSLTQPLFTWGKITNAVKLYSKVQDVRLLQRESIVRQKEAELYAREAAVYYLARMTEVLEEQAKVASRLVEISEAYEKNGMLLAQEVLDAKMQAQKIDVAQKNVRMEMESQVLEIRHLCSDNSIQVTDISFVPDEQKVPAYVDAEEKLLLEKAVSPESESLRILILLRQVTELTQKISEASVNWKPDFALQSSVGYAGSRFPLIEADWYRKDTYSLNFSIGLKTTVWDGGKAVRDVKRKRILTDDAGFDYETAVFTIRDKVMHLLLELKLNKSKAVYQELLIQSEGNEYRQKMNQFKGGYGSEIDALKKKVSELTEKLTLIQLNMDMYASCSSLDYLCGEKF